MKEIIFGRDKSCDYVLLDPDRKVSRRHGSIMFKDKSYFIKDLDSSNGTFLNNKKITSNQWVRLTPADHIVAANTIQIRLQDIHSFFGADHSDKTIVLGQSDSRLNDANETDKTLLLDHKKLAIDGQSNIVQLKVGDKRVALDPDKTCLDDLIDLTESHWVSLGRDASNQIVLKSDGISRFHCKLRLLTPYILEIEDLSSSNGTFADGKKLESKKKYKYDSSVKIRLGNEFRLDLKKVFPSIQLIEKKLPLTPPQGQRPSQLPANAPNSASAPATAFELTKFKELEVVWSEFSKKQGNANKPDLGISVLGVGIGIAAAAAGMGFGGMAVGGIIAQYLQRKNSSAMTGGETFEKMFYELYCCPRCEESFQKRPWYTIKECQRCKVKFK